MKSISIHELKGGEIIGKDILIPEGGTLLTSATKYRLSFKNRLLERGITNLFIDDAISESIEPPELLPQEIKTSLTNNLKKQFDFIQNVVSIDLDEINYITSIILETISSKEIILDMIDLKRNDSYTYSHCLNVAILSCAIALKMNFDSDLLENLIIGAILHDIGKMILPKDILNKPGKLTIDERKVLETHATLGYEFIKDEPNVSPLSKVIILCHHERENGKGYPLGKGTDLHLAPKIVAVSDVFDALISDRPYRKGFPINRALSILKQESLNVEVIKTLESIIAFYPVGSAVLLNNATIGLVEKNFSDDLPRPLLRIIFNTTSQMKEDYRCNLQAEPTLYITKKIDYLPHFSH